jgi:DNA-binding transcriptional LysR family regulator
VREELMELYQLRTFTAVASEGQLTRAAGRVHLSQPAVSAHIKALEEELELRLFERTPGGMVLTRAGRSMLAHAERVLSAVESLRQHARALRGEVAGRLRIGTLGDPQLIRIGEFLGEVVERYPQLELELHHEISGAALEAVRNGELDASFYFGDLEDGEVAGIALAELRYCVAAPAAWQPRIEHADWEEIAVLPWILAPRISTHHRLVKALFGAHGAEPQKIVEADNEPVIARLIESGVGVSLMPEAQALERARAGGVCIWRGARPRTTLWFVYQAARAGDPLIKALLEALRAAWQLESGGANLRRVAEPVRS